MSVLDDDLGGLAPAVGDAGWMAGEAAPSPDLRSLYEAERERADGAEALCEELRRSDLEARTEAGGLRSRLDRCRARLKAAAEETKAVRRTAKGALRLQSEVERLEKLLSAAGVDSRKHATLMSLRMEVGALRKENARLREAAPEGGSRRTVSRRTRNPQEQVEALRAERGELRREIGWQEREIARLTGLLERQGRATEGHKGTIRWQSREIAELNAELRRRRDRGQRVRELDEEVSWLRHAVKGGKAREEKLKARLGSLVAAGATLTKLPSDEAVRLRTALRRSRRHKTAMKSLSRENARLTRTVKALGRRNEALDRQLAKLQSTGAVLSKRLYGRKSEQQDKPRSGRKRGQQHGAAGHGRTQRPGLEERPELHNPPPEACVCSCCGTAYVPNGAEESTLVEIEVKAHKRVIRRPRWRRGCDCPSSPVEAIAPPAPRLFDNTLYGTGLWACFLYERYACFRTLNGVASWLTARGLPISPGTLAGSVERFVPLFEPLADAILAHQNAAAVRHADETGWRVQELRGEDRSSRAWLWTSVSHDAVRFHIDAQRSAEAAEKLLAGAVLYAVIVCDRYSAYKKLARMFGGLVILAWCWSHMRRDFIDCAAGHARLRRWCQGWIERIAEIYRLNDERLEHHDPALRRQVPAFDAAQTALRAAVEALFAQAESELAALPGEAREARVLRSLVNHRDGLCVFLDRPLVPMDNNVAERSLRGPAIGRRLSFGSDSAAGATFTAMMYSVVGTLWMNDIDVLRWLEAWLEACAENGGKAPDDLSPWLPWSMSEARRRKFTAPG